MNMAVPTDADLLSPHLAQFGLRAFRPGQREVIETVMSGGDCLCIMPTGGGKSLCYQLPAVARDGVTLVVSPLIALMKDQVDALTSLGIPATYINSSLGLAEQQERMEWMAQGRYRLIYVAPERLRNAQFHEKLRQAGVKLLAIDEAHCISQWGHDFRPDYARLGLLRQRLGSPQTIALTATATPEVRKDVLEQLRLSDPGVFITGFARENLRFEAEYSAGKRAKFDRLVELFEETAGPAIVYASTRKSCEELQASLSEGGVKRRFGVYHAGLEPEQRRKIQEEFMAGRIDAIIATNAFGMGIDKRDLRLVCHFNLPGSLEAYYQEAGRAGRDGLPSRCVLLFEAADLRIQEFFIESKYPSPEFIERVYDFLREIETDPIQLTLHEIKDELNLPISSEGIAACENILERAGVLERLESRQNLASVRFDTDLPTLVDLVPKEAKVQRQLLRALEKFVGEIRYDRVGINPVALARVSELEPAQITRAMRELCKLPQIDYVPPFRGRAVHMRERHKPFEELAIDFDELNRRKRAEYAKLQRMEGYARSRSCRQLEFLNYFGDPQPKKCGCCDNCGGRWSAPAIPAAKPQLHAHVCEAVRITLAGAARMQGRFGKQLLGKMLGGSQAKEITKLRLDRLSTFGMLGKLLQPELFALVDALLEIGLLEQVEEQRFRPLIRITPDGEAVMRGEAEVPAGLPIERELRQRLVELGPFAPPKPAASPQRIPPPPPEAKAASVPVKPPPPMPETNLYSEGESTLEPDSFGDFETVVEAPPLAEISPRAADRSTAAPPARTEIAEPAAPSAAETDEIPDSYWTWRLISAGFSLQECELIRKLDRRTLLAHLAAAKAAGLPFRAE